MNFLSLHKNLNSMKTMSLLFGLLAFTFVTVRAQTDNRKPEAEKTNRSGEDLKAADSKPLNGNENGQWTRLHPNEISPQMKKTLKDSKYNGWRTSGVYQNKDRSKFYVQAGEGSKKTRYEFDKSFRPINPAVNSGMGAGGDYPSTSPSPSTNR